jgi:hypothetical protein
LKKKRIDVSMKIFGSSCLQEYAEGHEEKEENFFSSSVRRHEGEGGRLCEAKNNSFFLLKIF